VQKERSLKIGILEWICGGGLHETDPMQIAGSLLDEGQAMLSAVAQDYLNCGYEVITCVDTGLVDTGLVNAGLVNRLRLFGSNSRIRVTQSAGFLNDLPSNWWSIADEVDAVVLIAPEFSSILQNAISKLSPICKLLINCGGHFLENTCDKWLTAQQLGMAQIHHPATQLVTAVTDRWLEQHRGETGKWIIKPRDGAGCDAIQVVEDDAVQSVLTLMRSTDLHSRMILQPLHQGSAFSRSAIVDAAGIAHWMPLVTQEFMVSGSMTYRGGRVLLASESPSLPQLDKVLESTFEALGSGARGWVGVDLLYSDALNDWMVIEVNPRLTTSFVGLSAACGAGLMEQMLRAARGMEVCINPTWNSVAFDAAGNVRCK
jgi:tyramine---L-glutamate ligase